jgi:hypothetical protein
MTYLGQLGATSWLVLLKFVHDLLATSDILKLVERAVEEIKRNSIGVASAHMWNEELDGGLGLIESSGMMGEVAIKRCGNALSKRQ